MGKRYQQAGHRKYEMAFKHMKRSLTTFMVKEMRIKGTLDTLATDSCWSAQFGGETMRKQALSQTAGADVTCSSLCEGMQAKSRKIIYGFTL